MIRIALGLGTNVGRREQQLFQAACLLEESVHLEQVSSIYETEPWGFVDQERFLNQVVVGETALSPQELLRLCKKIEEQLHRVPTFRNGPRTIDVDILTYGEQLIDEPDLKIPHIRIPERAFVLVPLMEIAPQWRNVRTGSTMLELANQASNEGVFRYVYKETKKIDVMTNLQTKGETLLVEMGMSIDTDGMLWEAELPECPEKIELPAGKVVKRFQVEGKGCSPMKKVSRAAVKPLRPIVVPAAVMLEKAFKADLEAKKLFDALEEKTQAKYRDWIVEAKRQQTRENRLKKLMAMLKKDAS